MTVCISVICPATQRILYLSDQLISSETASVEGALKFRQITTHGAAWITMFAGYAPRFASLMDHAEHKITGGALSDVIAAFESAYQIELLKRIETEVLLNFGWTRDEFLTHGRERLGDFRFSAMVEAISDMDLGIELLVAGYDADSVAHMFAVSRYGIVTRIDQVRYHAIGVGAQAAMGALYPLGRFYSGSSFEQILYRACVAKFTAEGVPGVGKDTIAMWQGRTAVSGILWSSTIDDLRAMWKDEGPPPIPAAALSLITKDSLIFEPVAGAQAIAATGK